MRLIVLAAIVVIVHTLTNGQFKGEFELGLSFFEHLPPEALAEWK